MVELVLDDTDSVVTVKVLEVDPAGTVTLAGTVAAAVLLLVRSTVMPPVGASAERVTVPVEEVPPVTVVGLTLTEERLTLGAFTVKVAVLVVPV